MGNIKKVDQTEIEQAIKSALASETVSFENMWLDLSRYKNLLLVLKQIIIGDGQAYGCEELTKQTIYKALTHLKKTGDLKQIEEGRYALIDPLFEEYLKAKWIDS